MEMKANNKQDNDQKTEKLTKTQLILKDKLVVKPGKYNNDIINTLIIK
jgi:hypothetical protein